MTHPRLYFAFRSPYSRLGLAKLAAAGVSAQHVAFTGPAGGAAFVDPTSNPHKRDYMVADVLRMTLRAGLPLQMPKPFDPDYAPANLAFAEAELEGRGGAFALAVSNARWGAGRDISDLAVLSDCARACGLPDDLPQRAQENPNARQLLRDQRALIEEDGVFGVPFLVADGAKYWGQDRIDLYLELRTA